VARPTGHRWFPMAKAGAFAYNSLLGRADRIKMRAHNYHADANQSSSTQDRPVIG
jgi:hypothetical protein